MTALPTVPVHFPKYFEQQILKLFQNKISDNHDYLLIKTLQKQPLFLNYSCNIYFKNPKVWFVWEKWRENNHMNPPQNFIHAHENCDLNNFLEHSRKLNRSPLILSIHDRNYYHSVCPVLLGVFSIHNWFATATGQ